MYNHKLENPKIVSLDKAIKTLETNFTGLAEAIVREGIFLIIIPKNFIRIGIRSKKQLIKKPEVPPKNNPYDITIENPDGFIPRLKDNEKILNNLSLKTCEPLEVVYTDGQYEFGISLSPSELANYKSLEQDKKNKETVYRGFMNAVAANLRYSNQEFYFKEESAYSTNIELKEIFISNDDFGRLNKVLSGFPSFDFEDIGDYQPNRWSSQFIRDINAIHSALIKNNLGKRSAKTKKLWEELVRDSLKKRWEGKKYQKKVCLAYIPQAIIGNLRSSVNMEAIEVRDDQRSRNRDNATDLIILFDVLAEGYYKQLKGSKTKDQILDKLEKAGIKTKDHQEAYYSIVRQSGKRKISSQ